MTKRVSICLALVASLAGCAQPVTVSDATRLKEDEGVIVYSMQCGPGIAWGQIYRSGESTRGFSAESRRAGLLPCPEGVQTQRLKAGRYFVGKVGYQGLVDFSEETAMQFGVTAGKLNYIGHITLPSAVDETQTSGRVLISDPFVSDRGEETRAWLAANQAALHAQHEFVAGVAQSPSKLTKDEPAEQGRQSGAIEFTVILKLRVAANGSVKEGHIARSSGNPSVDEAARNEAVRHWWVAPGIDSGKPVEKWANYSVTYRAMN